jgi:hypothetical protein
MKNYHYSRIHVWLHKYHIKNEMCNFGGVILTNVSVGVIKRVIYYLWVHHVGKLELFTPVRNYRTGLVIMIIPTWCITNRIEWTDWTWHLAWMLLKNCGGCNGVLRYIICDYIYRNVMSLPFGSLFAIHVIEILKWKMPQYKWLSWKFHTK